MKGIADELFDLLLEGPLRAAAVRAFRRIGEAGFLDMDEAEADKAIRLLSQTPSQRARTLARLDDEAAALLILRARYMGLCSYMAMLFAERFAYVPGKSYRGAAEHGAREVTRARLRPTIEEVMKADYGRYTNLLAEVADDAFAYPRAKHAETADR